MVDTETSDGALLERLRVGDAAALEPLMERFANRLYRIANGICGSAADAEEVVQDVFLTAFRKASSFEGRGSAPGSIASRSTQR